MRDWRGRSELDRTESTASSAKVSWKTSGYVIMTTIGQDYSTFYITMGFADRRNYQEEWLGHWIVYRLSTSKSTNRADGISNAVDQWAFTRHGYSDVVLLTRYGKQVLGSRDDRTNKKNFRIQYAVRLIWVATDAVWAKNAPQIHQRLIDNALFGYLKIEADQDASSMEPSKRIDVFTEG